MKEDLQFIPCDVHPEIQAVTMEVLDSLVVRFKCEGCRVGVYIGLVGPAPQGSPSPFKIKSGLVPVSYPYR